jgi:ACT domain-containing protein
MHAVVTVTGKDSKGLIAKISAFLAEKNANIEDISQTILGEYFAMIMLVNISETTEELASLAKEASDLGKKIGVTVYMQHEDIFKAMHNI